MMLSKKMSDSIFLSFFAAAGHTIIIDQTQLKSPDDSHGGRKKTVPDKFKTKMRFLL
jgi:hypothetical protein